MAPITASAPKMTGGSIELREPSLPVKLLTAGSAACVADLFTYPLDTAKVRLQIQGEAGVAAPVRYYITTAASALGAGGNGASMVVEHAAPPSQYKGMIGTVSTIARQEGPKALYNGLAAGLQRQMCFASIRIGLYDSIKSLYQQTLNGGKRNTNNKNTNASISVRIFAGITTGGLAVLLAQPTDVVKVRMQAEARSTTGIKRYSGTMNAYSTIARKEGVAGLWKGTLPNVSRNAIVNVAEIVCYDLFKEYILSSGLLKDGVPCHFSAAVAAGFCTTVVASPVDVVKTRFMNAPVGQYRGAVDCAVRMMMKEGPIAFYKGFVPSFSRLVSWNICMWITYEQFKRLVLVAYNQPTMLNRHV
ncbi:mitochondrial uncoupling protein 2-like [Daphnia pulex]|uniref:mitochondrial uncoupling protein 2-like n=1 Tax=Daphnia pulex TaxID=6669 RepID=UPI001EDE5EE7|nr:mitochondrial uncoupling protein 2-like [Daphnia pulex]XP_046464221.1 mitochondrial uncoupling protein 2-like [Daphnia pulex]